MRASIYHRFGEPSEVLNEEDGALPSPGANQVRVKTILSPIHNHDLWTVRGTYGHKPDLPATRWVRSLPPCHSARCCCLNS